MEVIWAYYLKKSEGFTKLSPSVLFIITMVISMLFLSLSVKEIPISIAYPIWTGIGAVGSVFAGIYLFGEKTSKKKMFFLVLIIIGIIGLKVL